MFKYPSVPTLEEYKKDKNNPNPETLSWIAEEKIDGQNVGIQYEDGILSFYGREKSELEPEHKDFVKKLFDVRQLNKIMPLAKNYFVFGELFGRAIGVNAKHYSEEYQFKIFDILMQSDNNPSGFIWLEREAIKDIANKLGIETPFLLKPMNLEAIYLFLYDCYNKKLGFLMFNNKFFEGLVLRNMPLMLNRKEERIMFKLKKEDLFFKGITQKSI